MTVDIFLDGDVFSGVDVGDEVGIVIIPAVELILDEFEVCNDDFIKLTAAGNIILEKGYGSDRASGGAWDLKTNARAFWFHDGAYQLVCRGFIKYSRRQIRKIDQTYRDLSRHNGANHFSMAAHYRLLCLANGRACRRTDIIIAP